MATAHIGTVITGVAIYICTNGIKEGVNWKTTQELGKETTGFNAKTKFCQGSLKGILFGKQHSQGGCNENPTNHPFLKNAGVNTNSGNCGNRPCTVEPLLSRRSGIHYCLYLRNVRN